MLNTQLDHVLASCVHAYMQAMVSCNIYNLEMQTNIFSYSTGWIHWKKSRNKSEVRKYTLDMFYLVVFPIKATLVLIIVIVTVVAYWVIPHETLQKWKNSNWFFLV